MPRLIKFSAVLPIDDSHLEFLESINCMLPPIPEEAKYVAFPEEGGAIFLTSIDNPNGQLRMPRFTLMSVFDDVVAVIPDDALPE